MAQPALIFIPDISGFTRFVTRTEIQHANHIISELVDVILDSNALDLEVSEIEGDAVLFYRVGAPPDTEALLNQAHATFVAFHRYLKVIERDAVCQCGACTQSPGLTLKFVAHYGELDEVRIREFLKLMGQDVILAHRLLKNAVPGNEYLLLTAPLLAGRERAARNASWARFTPFREVVPEFGDVEGAYVELTPLRDAVPEPPPRRPLRMGGGIEVTQHIAAPLAVVHDHVTDMSKRLQWAHGLKDIIGGEPINRVGESHTCVFDNLEVHVVTLDHRATRDGFHYSESGAAKGLVLVTNYHLTERDGATELVVSVTPTPPDPSSGAVRSFVQRLRAWIVLRFVKRGVGHGLATLKVVCEAASSVRDPDQHQTVGL